MSEFFIKISNIRFNSVDDLYYNKDYIRDNYLKLDYNDQELYKWYFFYQLCILKNPLKRMLWDYVNGIDCTKKDIDLLEIEYLELCQKKENMFKKKRC